MKRIDLMTVLIAISLATGLLYAQTGSTSSAGGQSPAAAAVLDRYVEVTGGVAAYKKINSQVTEVTMTGPNGSSAHMTMFQSRDGREQEEMEVGGKLVQQRGVANGIAWEYSDVTGARTLSGKEAERRITSANAFLDDDWRKQFPAASVVGEENIDGVRCVHLRLVRNDGSSRDNFYDKKTGLLLREVMKDDDADKDPNVMTTTSYAQSDGLKYASTIRAEHSGIVLQLKVDSVRFSPKPPSDAFVLPDKVLRAMADKKSGSGMPNAIDLLEHYVAQTGGKDKYAHIKSEKLTGEISFATAGLKGTLVLFEADGGRLYTAFDLPGAGKFESGSDGKISWEQSVLMGPRIVPQSEGSRGMLGPGPDQIMKILRGMQSVETMGKGEANGAPCWSIRLQSRNAKESPTTMCFDVESGYLTHLTGISKTQMGTTPIDVTMSDYRDDGGIRSPHHLRTAASGQSLDIEITSVVINGPLPDGVFDLPSEIKALASKKAAGTNATTDKDEGVPPERPSLRRAK